MEELYQKGAGMKTEKNSDGCKASIPPYAFNLWPFLPDSVLVLENPSSDFDIPFDDGGGSFEFVSEILNRQDVDLFNAIGTDLGGDAEAHGIEAIFIADQVVFLMNDGDDRLDL